MVSLATYASNIVSQNGEDGIIAEIFRRITPASRTCVEFGAWDGKHLSNTWALWHDAGWSALLIEGDSRRFSELLLATKDFPAVSALHAYVRVDGESSLDRLLAGSLFADRPIDLLSIDIDGDDYHVWAALDHFKPRVVVIEYNPTIPPEVDVVQRVGEYFGASAGSLLRLAHQKGYRLAACTATNCIFVADEDFPSLGLTEVDLHPSFDRSQLSYVINAYDGRTFLSSHPIYSRPFPLASFEHWWERLRDNLFVNQPAIVLPADQVVPVSIVMESMLPRRSLFGRVSRRLASLTSLFSDWLANLITSLPPYRFCERVVFFLKRKQDESAQLQAWRRSGSPIPPPHLLKQKLLLQYSRRYGLRTLVETGTYLGDMVFAMRKRFKRIVSIELSHDLCTRAKARFADTPNVSILQGDSSIVLPTLLETLHVPTLFWLDGHYSAGNTALGSMETPISAEIDAILTHSVRGHVILIDDARNFDGSHDYPSLVSLQQSVMERSPKASFSVRDDVIRIVL